MRHAILLAIMFSLPRGPAAQAPREIRIGSVEARLPPGARVVPHPHGRGRFGGTRVQLEERLIVELAAVPASGLPLKAYVDSLAVARNAHLRPAWQLQPAAPLTIAGRTAWVLRPRCGDCDAVEAYLDFPGTRLVVAWGVDGLEALTAAQRHALAWRFVSALRPAPPAG